MPGRPLPVHRRPHRLIAGGLAVENQPDLFTSRFRIHSVRFGESPNSGRRGDRSPDNGPGHATMELGVVLSICTRVVIRQPLDQRTARKFAMASRHRQPAGRVRSPDNGRLQAALSAASLSLADKYAHLRARVPRRVHWPREKSPPGGKAAGSSLISGGCAKFMTARSPSSARAVTQLVLRARPGFQSRALPRWVHAFV